jgi:hypothetical protein
MTEWKVYTGSDEQIMEIADAVNGVILRYKNGNEITMNTLNRTWGVCLEDVTHFCVCNPHPLADMICQQAKTGQPVWVRYEWRDSTGPGVETYVTSTPDWNIPNAEYSFKPLEEITGREIQPCRWDQHAEEWGGSC